MNKTYGLGVTDFRIQLKYFTAKCFDKFTGVAGAVKGGVGFMIGNIIRRNQYAENNRKGMQEYADKHGYSYQQISTVVEGALSAWLAHIAAFKSGV